jgi:CSLREA domain-containing protein
MLATFTVTTTSDSADPGSGSLRAAILAANLDLSPGTDEIDFAIPASTSADLTVPVPGFDPVTQVWTISPATSLPALIRPISIDGYTQTNALFRYPSDITSSVQLVTITGLASGGTFTLTGSAPLPTTPSAAIPFNATAAQVQSDLETIYGAGNVSVTGGPVNSTIGVTITFEGTYADLAIPNLTATGNLTGDLNPTPLVQTVTVGGVLLPPSVISSVPNSESATGGNTAQIRVIITGEGVPSGPDDVGLTVEASNTIVRGLAISGFDIGVLVPDITDVGDLIQGNQIGNYLIFPVDSQTGAPVTTDTVVLTGAGNAQQGIVLGSANATVGGLDPQDDNVIAGNGAQGVVLEPGASGNQVLGNQIGVIGPSGGYYFAPGNGEQGVLIESLVTPGDEASAIYTSSNVIGGAVSGSGNVISSNGTDGIDIDGVGATRNLIEANYIGLTPGGGYTFGTGDPGNSDDGVLISDAPDNQVGGPVGAGNVISANGLSGVNITGPNATGNTVLNNIIGLTSAGTAVLGNHEAGVTVTAPAVVIGPGNVISANLIGILISGPAATDVNVIGNLIGTDSSGEADLGNAEAGVDIENATGTVVKGTSQDPQVISGNAVGIEIDGALSTGNLVAGNFIGIDAAGTADRGNSHEGVLIENAAGNTVGGTTSAATNVISANLWGIRLDGSTAMGNLVEGNLIGTDASGTLPLGNEANGIIFSTGASDNSIGGTAGGQGNTIAFNVDAGVLVQSGTGDSILSNSIYANGQEGVVLTGTANNAQAAPSLSGATGGGTGSNIQGKLVSVADTSFLIQFFSSLVADPSGFGQGQTFLGSTTVTTNPTTDTATINFNLSSGLTVGVWVTVMATNLDTGDTSAFSNALAAQAVNVGFSTAAYVVSSTTSAAVIDVVRSGNLSVQSTVNYATSNGSAVAGQNYKAVTGTLDFPPGASVETFSVPILAATNGSVSAATLNLVLSGPGGGTTLGAISSAILTITYTGGTGSEFVVTNTAISGAGSLWQAITDVNADPNPGVDHIIFEIPASTAANLNVAVPGFDPSTQTWTISLTNPLPVITHPVSIDGYSQAKIPVPFRYPAQVSSAVQTLIVSGDPTGGSFTLTTSAPLPVGTTPPIPYNATATEVMAALTAIIPADDVTVTVGPVNTLGVTISFQGDYAAEAIPNLVANSGLIGGVSPTIAVATLTVGGVPLTSPTLISSLPNSQSALAGNNAQVRVIIDGTGVSSGPTDIGLVVDASDSIVRGMAIEGFNIGVEIPQASNAGDLIQGNFIGEYLAYPFDPELGTPEPAPNSVELIGNGNSLQGVVLYSRNTTLGGADAQDSNVIGGNGMQGVLIEPGASGNQVLNNQIGLAGPASNNFYFSAGNGADGVLIASSGTASDPSGIVYASSNTIGSTGAGNLISDNAGAGVHIMGVGATRNLVEGNNIGLAAGGGYVFGDAQPGNLGDGVWIDDAPDNQIGGSSAGNVISSNAGNGVDVTGADALGNTVAGNVIGLTSAGSAALGNNQAGVADTAPGTMIGGPTAAARNVISANLTGVLISGSVATDVTVEGNLIGTDQTGHLRQPGRRGDRRHLFE